MLLLSDASPREPISKADFPPPLNVTLRIFSHAGEWRIELESELGRFSKWVSPLAQHLTFDEIPQEQRSWSGLVSALSPVTGFRPGLPLLRKAGRQIWQQLFSVAPIGAHLVLIEAHSREHNRPIRFFIDTCDEEEFDEHVARLPVELSFDGKTFLFKDQRHSAVRLVSNIPRRNLRLPASPKVLIATARTTAEPHPTLEELSAHSEAIRQQLADRGFDCRVLAEATPSSLRQALCAGVDILYLICHGLEDPDETGRLLLKDGSVTGNELARWMVELAEDGKGVAVVLLCACSSAVPQVKAETSGLAQWLVKRGAVLSALGFRGPVSVSWALSFMRRLFNHWSSNRPLDAAFSAARYEEEDGEPQWLLPLLYRPLPDFSAEARHAQAPVQPPFPLLRSVLPREPRTYFTAREEELTTLRKWLTQPGAALISTVEGGGGIGKSELAAVLAHESRQKGRPVLWLERADRDVLGSLMTMITAVEPHYQLAPDAPLQDAVIRMRRVLAQVPGLLILDDVSNATDLASLLPGNQWNVLITSRESGLLPQAVPVELKPLTEIQSLLLFCRVAYGTSQPPANLREEVQSLVRLLGGIPLALEVVAAALRSNLVSVSAFLDELKQGKGTARSASERVFTVLTRSVHELSPTEREAFWVLGVLPDVGAPLETVARALAAPPNRVTGRMDRLVRYNLAAFSPETGRYTLHPLSREAARSAARLESALWARLHQQVADALSSLAEWVREPIGQNSDQSTARWETVQDIFERLDTDDWINGCPGGAKIANVLLLRADRRVRRNDLDGAAKDYDDALGLFVKVESRLGQANVLQSRGELRVRRNDLDGAAKDYDDALGLFVKVEDRLGQANVLKSRGELRAFLDDLDGAAKDYDDALGLFVKVEDRLGQANVLKSRGKLRAFLDDLDGAAKDYDDALGLFVKVESRLGQANVLQSRGELRAFLDDLDGAAKDYDDALGLFVKVESRLGQANVLQSRGELRAFLDDLDGAAKDYDDALGLFVKVESRLGQAHVLKSRGELRVRRNDLDGAAKDYDDALGLFVKVEDRLGQAHVLQSRGELRVRRNDLDGAAKDYDDALGLFVKVEDRLGQAHVLQSRGELRVRRNDLDGAAKDYDDALGLFVKVESRLGQANVLKSRGKLRAFLDDLDGAAKDYDDALGLFVKVESRLGQAHVLKSRGELRVRRNDLDGAAKDYDDALGLFVKVEDRLGQANVLKSRGELRAFLDDLDGAAKDYDDALGLFVKVEDRLGQANVLKSRGELRAFLDDLDGAAKDYDDALGLFVKVESRLGQANVLQSRGELRAFLDDLDGAAKDYDDALGLFVKVESRLGQANVLQSRGQMQVRLQKWADARPCFEQALALYEAIEEPLGQSTVLAELARVAVMLDQPETANAYAERAINICKRHPNQYALNLARRARAGKWLLSLDPKHPVIRGIRIGFVTLLVLLVLGLLIRLLLP